MTLYLDQNLFICIYIYLLLKEKAFYVSIRLKKTYLLKLDLILFRIYDASESQFKFDSISILTPTPTHISLCPHLKKLLVVSHKMNRTSTCRSHCRMTSIMFKFRQTDGPRADRKKEGMNKLIVNACFNNQLTKKNI